MLNEGREKASAKKMRQGTLPGLTPTLPREPLVAPQHKKLTYKVGRFRLGGEEKNPNDQLFRSAV